MKQPRRCAVDIADMLFRDDPEFIIYFYSVEMSRSISEITNYGRNNMKQHIS